MVKWERMFPWKSWYSNPGVWQSNTRVSLRQHPSEVYPTSGWTGHGGRNEGWKLLYCSLLSLAPSCPLRSPPIICPDVRTRGPKEPFGTQRKEGANCSCDVGIVVPFTGFAMETGHWPWKHALPPASMRVKGQLEVLQIITVSLCAHNIPNIWTRITCLESLHKHTCHLGVTYATFTHGFDAPKPINVINL